jgi:ligand-binding sensor domain-containing protein
MINGENPFEFVTTLNDILPGSQAVGFQHAPDGSLWMITNAGIARLTDSGWTAYLSKHEGHFVGMDTFGRAWSINPDPSMDYTAHCLGPSGPCFINPHMDSISAWDGAKWTRYASESGWTSFSVVPAPGPNFSMAELDGQIWISTSVDVRVFDGSRWRVITLEEIGLTPPFSSLTIQAFAGTKEVWVIGCYFNTPPPHRSVIYSYDGSKWENRSVPEENSGCLQRAQEARQGNVWLTADETLWRFTRATKQWVKFTPPASASSPNYIRALALNKAGEPWLTTMSSNRPIFYHLQNDVWLPTIQLHPDSRYALLFIDSADRVWITTHNGIYQILDDQPVLVSHLEIAAPLTMDSSGRIWVVGRDSSSVNRELSLWVVNP